jgi:hypothetical protein
MRSTNINSIANVVCRFSVSVDAMLRAFAAPQQQWHLQPCVGPISDRHSGADRLLWIIGTVGARNSSVNLPGNYLSGTFEPAGYLTTNMVLKRLFQRLS